MILQENLDLICQYLDQYYALWASSCPAGLRQEAKLPDWTIEDGGVPQPMQAGEIDQGGYVTWKMLPSTLKEESIIAVETEFNVPFPPLFRAYLTARFHLFSELSFSEGSETVSILLPALPCDNPLGELRGFIDWGPFLHTGFVPFGDYQIGYGPLCFDSTKQLPDGDCPVVWFDHDELFSLSEEQLGNRESVEPLAHPLFSSFRELLAKIFE